MVTGYNAVMLERHLAGSDVIFLRNDRYETTQMFDSVKIGLAYLQEKCDRVLFTPVDIPLFTSGTVMALLACSEKLACPVCQGKQGHPLLISASLFQGILADSGEQGLRGAVARSGARMYHVPVEDSGTLYDADTPADYSALVEYHNSQPVFPGERSCALEESTCRLDGRRFLYGYSIHNFHSSEWRFFIGRSE